MVLRRVGERAVDILVNGTQEASYVQTDEQANYDLTVNETGGTIEFIAASGTVGSDFNGFYNAQSFASVEADEIKVTADDKFEEGGIVVEWQYDGNYNEVSCNPVGESAWVSVDPNLGYISIDGISSGGYADYKVELRKQVTDGFSVDDVTQS